MSSNKTCPRTQEVPEKVTEEVAEEVTAEVVHRLLAAVAELPDGRRLPHPGPIWWQAQRDRQRDAARRAALPIAVFERFAWIAGVAAALLGLALWGPGLMAPLYSAASAPPPTTTAASGIPLAESPLWIGIAVLIGLVGWLFHRDWLEPV